MYFTREVQFTTMSVLLFYRRFNTCLTVTYVCHNVLLRDGDSQTTYHVTWQNIWIPCLRQYKFELKRIDIMFYGPYYVYELFTNTLFIFLFIDPEIYTYISIYIYIHKRMNTTTYRIICVCVHVCAYIVVYVSW